MASIKTYIDQNQAELYDIYDFEANEPVPQMLLEAKVIRQGKSVDVIQINYPVVDGTWTLEGRLGRALAYEEIGKKAFVRNGFYEHPVKGWESYIVLMSPLEYIEACAELFSKNEEVTVEDLIETRIDDYDFEEVFTKGQGQIFYLVIDYKRNTQEGLHRAIWALEKNLETVPVIVIK